ncbi:Taurine catabolism dioxygenase TauD, TfdA family [compost metagenome]
MNSVVKNPLDQVCPVSVEELGSDVHCHTLQAGRPPLFIEPCNDALRDRTTFRAWSARIRPVLDRLIVEHGGIVLRGFPIEETADFGNLAELFPAFSSGYAGGVAPRSTISGRVMEATRLAAPVRLTLHSEMAYMRDYPKRIAFFCRRASPVGGETIIGDMRTLVDELPAELVSKIERLGIRTTRNYGAKSDQLEQSVEIMESIGWNVAFGTDDPQKVEALCAERGLEPLWNDNGTLTVFNRTDPFVIHPQTGRRLYRSILHVYRADKRPEGENTELYEAIRKTQQHPSGTFLGNGGELSGQEVEAFEAIIDRHTHCWPWRNGDVMILDNLQVWHGRNPYEGPRDVQVALLD